VSGIVAAHGRFDPEVGERMLERLAHRGPDGQGTRQVGESWLGHRRLAIVDQEGGAQPMADPNGGLWLVGDGEIYNHDRLRAHFGEQRFRSRSDHEAALVLFEEGGIEGFERLWGAFAFAVAGEDGRFVVSRDTFGIAPLYWAQRDGTVVFASELKAFDEGLREAVEPFPPGHAWTPQDGLHPWRPAPSAAPVLLKSYAPEDEPPGWVFDAVRGSLVRAIERQLIADVPVGVFLSGGLDSSIVTAIAARALQRDGQRPLKTFAAGLADSPDLLAARQVAEHTGTDHYEYVYTADEAIELVPEVIALLESFDPTLVHSAVPNYLVARLAREHVKAVLIGEGADELFAGYSHYAQQEDAELLHAELLETIGGLHIGGLQRVDRVTGAVGLEARIPFLDLDLVELAMALPPDWKLVDDERPAKWLLRRAFDDWLPRDVVWRKKEQFGQGTGMDTVLSDHFGATVSEEELERERDVIAPPLRTREELAYYRLFVRALPGVRAEGNIGRFVEA
jgi:asparagine synthase (glutamine-hydrolysing)